MAVLLQLMEKWCIALYRVKNLFYDSRRDEWYCLFVMAGRYGTFLPFIMLHMYPVKLMMNVIAFVHYIYIMIQY